MKKLIMILLALSVVLSACGTKDESAAENTQTNQISVTVESTFDVSDYSGKPTLAVFWATWCHYCVSEMVSLNKLAGEYGDQVAIVMINVSDTKEDIVSFMQDKGYDFTTNVADSSNDIANEYGVYALPTILFFDSTGNISDTVTGQESYETLKEKIDNLLS